MLKNIVTKTFATITFAFCTIGVLSTAHATALSMNEVAIPEDADLRACQSLATEAFAMLGLDGISTGFSVVAVTPSDDLATIYCLPDHDLAIIAIAGESSATTRPTLGELMVVAANWVD